MYYLEHQGSGWVGFFPRRRTESSFDNNNILFLQEVHGKDEYLQAIQVLAPRFRFFGTFVPDNENAGGSAICIHRDLLPEEAFVTHLVICHGRDHIVRIQSGRQSPVIVNVHFEPELALRPSRDAVGIILGDFNVCEPEEGRFNVWNQTFPDGDTGERLLSLIKLGATLQPFGGHTHSIKD